MDRESRERLIASRTAFDGGLLTVRVDEVQTASGRRATREVVSHPGAAAVVPLLPEGRVVLIRQYRHAAGRTLWELPAGILGPGEAPEECARRELIEEAGYEAGNLSLLFSTYLSPGYSGELIHIFRAGDLRPVPARLEPDEEIVPVAVPLEDAVAMVRRGEVQNAAAICGLLAVACWHCAAEEETDGAG